MTKKQTNHELVARLRQVANLETFGMIARGDITEDAIREATALYRNTWLAPVIDEVERRLCGSVRR